MRFFAGYILMAVLVVSGCAGGLVPDASRNVTLAPDGRSIVQTDKDWQLKAAIYQEAVLSTGSDSMMSFLVTAKNKSLSPAKTSRDGFYLLVNGDVQKRPVAPETVREITLSTHQFLLPYPYVGYYYRNDTSYPSILNVSPDALVESSQEILLTAFPSGDVLPGTVVEGLLYFPTAGISLQSAELIYLPEGTTFESTPFRFPFVVAK